MSRQIELSLDPAPSAPGREDALTDVHSHLVPGVDDGARSPDEALAAMNHLAASGVRTILATPHIDASVIHRPEVFSRVQRKVETAWAEVVERGRERHPGMSFHLGREIMLDTSMPDLEDPRVRLNGGRYVLVEYPRLNIPPASADVLDRIAARKLVPVVAHVERYFYHGTEEEILGEWRSAGAAFQVNGASLVGKYGATARVLAWELLARGWVALLASDYHARGETWISEARSALAERGGEEQERLLWSVNPQHIVRSEPFEEVPPLARPAEGRWSRLRGIFRGES